MPRFIAVHTIPTMTEERVIALAKNKVPKGIAWKKTYCDFTDGKFFCDWEAANKEAIEEYFKTEKFRFDAIYPVRRFDVDKKKFKDKA